MGYVMGDDETFCTWGAMRSPFYNARWADNDPPPNFFNGKSIHSRTYVDDADGVDYPPTFFLDESGSLFRTDPVGFNQVGCAIRWEQSGSPSSWNGYMTWGGLDNQDFDQFVGSVLTSPTDTVTLTADANTTAGQYLEYTPPLSIDLYPGFTTIDGMTVIP
jgi:hypothetical protein